MKLLPKVYISVLIVLGLIIVGWSVFAQNLILRPTTGGIDGEFNIEIFIRNSNGNYWSFTEANIQTAIDDLDDTTDELGTVTLPGNQTLTLTTGIDVKRYTIFDQNGCELRTTSDINVLNLSTNTEVKNGVIRVTAASNANAILIDGEFTNPTYANPIYIHDMQLIHGDYNGTAINLSCDGNSETIVGVTCDNIMINRFEYGILLDCSGGTGGSTSYINGNTFTNINGRSSEYFIYLNDSGVNSGANGNAFDNVQFQTGSRTECAFYCEGSSNQFMGHIWDWSSGAGTYSVNLTSNTEDNYLRFNVVLATYIDDAGSGNEIDDHTHTIKNYQYIPCTTTSPYENPTTGATYFVTGNQTLAVYWNSKWHYFEST